MGMVMRNTSIKEPGTINIFMNTLYKYRPIQESTFQTVERYKYRLRNEIIIVISICNDMFYLIKCFTKTGILAGMGAETTLPAKEEDMYVNVGNIENATINVEKAEIHIHQVTFEYV